MSRSQLRLEYKTYRKSLRLTVQLDQSLEAFESKFSTANSELGERIAVAQETFLIFTRNRSLEDVTDGVDKHVVRQMVSSSDVCFSGGSQSLLDPEWDQHRSDSARRREWRITDVNVFP